MAQLRNRGSNIWQISVFLGKDDNGKKITHYETFHGNKTQAKDYAHDLEKKHKSKIVGSSKTIVKTVDDLIDKWLDYLTYDCETIESTTKNTYVRHTNRIRRYVKDLQLFNLEDDVIESRIKVLNQENLKPRTIKNYYAILKRIFNWGASKKYCRHNLMQDIKPPKVGKTDRDTYRGEELKLFLETAKDYKHHLILRLLAVSGLRVGEAMGLRWKSVSLERKQIIVVESINSRLRNQKEPKTLNSPRTIGLDDETANLILQYKKEMSKQNKASKTDFVFQSPDGEPLRYQVIIKTKEKVLKKAGLHHIRIHDLRHGVGAILLDKGKSLIEVAGFLGQNPATTASVYSHAIRKGHSDDVLT